MNAGRPMLANVLTSGSGTTWKAATLLVLIVSALVSLFSGNWISSTSADSQGTGPGPLTPEQTLLTADPLPQGILLAPGEQTSITLNLIDATGSANQTLPNLSISWVVNGPGISIVGPDTTLTVVIEADSPGVATLQATAVQQQETQDWTVIRETTIGVVDPDVLVERSVSSSVASPGQEITVSVDATNVDHFYAVRETLGQLELLSDTADNFEDDVFVMLGSSSFEYVVRVPFSAQPGDSFAISGEFWEDPAVVRGISPADTTITVDVLSPAIQRTLSSSTASPGDEITVTIEPTEIALFYAVREDIGQLELVSNTADNFEQDAFVMLGPDPFQYTVQVPATAQNGDTFPISGVFWEDPGIELVVSPADTLITVEVATTPTPTATTPAGGGGGGGGFAPAPAQPTATPAPSTPTQPLNVVAEPGDSSVTLSWDAPESDGGAPVTGYRIFNTVTATATTVGASVFSHTVTGLTNGVAYSFQVSAINASGNGPSVLVGPVIPEASGDSDDAEAVESAARSAFGEGVEITDPKPSIDTGEPGVTAVIGATGVTEGQLPVGGLSIESDDLTLDADETGAGTATLILGEELVVSGPVEVMGAADGIAIQFQDPDLLFTPQIAPEELSLLAPNVGTPAASFNVDLTSVTDGVSVSATYSDTVPGQVAATTFALEGLIDPVVLDDIGNDVAYSISVEKTGLDNEQLGDNTVSMRVSEAWFDSMTEAGKAVVITKTSDNGDVFVEQAVCIQDGTDRICTATFSGAAGGFSEFTLLALTTRGNPTPTPTPTAVPVPQPTPTATPAPSPTATVLSAPIDPPTPVPTTAGTVSPTATVSVPTATTTPSPTALPQVVPTVPTDVGGGGDDSGGGVPAWIFILVGVGTVAALGIYVARGLIKPLYRRS